MNDVFIVASKEWRELLGGRGLRGKSGVLLTIVVFGVVLPLQSGRAWVESPIVLAGWAWVPMFLVASVITEAFAGERERHTLDTLLATRLSNTAILYGKLAAAIIYALAVSLVSLLLGVIAVNLQLRGDGLILYSAKAIAGVLALGSLGAIFIAAIGTLISLQAQTVRQAVQLLGGAIMLMFVVPIVIFRKLGAAAIAWAVSADVMRVSIVACVLWVLLDLAMLKVVSRAFNRARITVAR